MAFAIIAAPGASGSSLFSIIELFSIANQISSNTRTRQTTPLFNTTLCTLEGEAIFSSGISIAPEKSVTEIASADLLYIAPPGISSEKELTLHTAQWNNMVAWLQTEHTRFRTIASHCSGTFILAQAGLLTGGRATTAWWLCDMLVRNHPELEVDTDAIVLQSGKCCTAAGTSAYQDLGLELLRQLAGSDTSRLAAKYLMTDRQRRSQSSYRLDLPDRSNGSDLVPQARQWIKENLAHDFKIDDLASALEIRPRTLLRRFQQHTGGTPLALVQSMRMERSKILFETTDLPTDTIARRCGYRDESAFRRVFKRHCGLSPKEYRLRFRAKPDHSE